MLQSLCRKESDRTEWLNWTDWTFNQWEACSFFSFPSVFRLNASTLFWDLSSFVILWLNFVHFKLLSSFPCDFYFGFWVFRNMLSIFHVAVNFSKFFGSWCLNSIVIWEHVCLFSIVLNLLRLILWPNMWSYLENIQCAFVKNDMLLLLRGVFYTCLLGLVSL